MSELIYRIRRLRTWGSVLHVGAHPDDEEIGLIAWLTHKLGIRTVYWSATRGEGGQDWLGRYEGEALGIYRTWESLAAREVDGGESLFGPFYDYDYAKTAGEVFRKWRREDVVREIVRAIRVVQPQVVIARWTGGEADQHGHHKAVAEAVVEAFRRAGDPDAFPELDREDLPPWTPSKLYQSVTGDWTPGEADLRFGERRPELERPGYVAVNTGEFDPVAGETYQERAWRAFNSHITQAVGFAPAPGDFWYYYRRIASRVDAPESESSLFDGLDPRLPGMAAHFRICTDEFRSTLHDALSAADRALERFHPDEPAASAEDLLAGLESVRAARALAATQPCVPAAVRVLDRKVAAFERVVAACLGLRLDATVERARVTPGERIVVSTKLWSPEPLDEPETILVHGPAGWRERRVDDRTFDVVVPADAEPSQPYWLRAPRDPYRYAWPEGQGRGQPFDAPVLHATAHVRVRGHDVALRSPVVHRAAFPGGYRELPLSVIPPVSLEIQPDVLLVPLTVECAWTIEVTVRSNTSRSVAGLLCVDAPEGWDAQPSSARVELNGEGESAIHRFELRGPAGRAAGRNALRFRVHCEGREYASVVHPVRLAAAGHQGEPTSDSCVREAFHLAPAELAVHVVDVTLPQRLRIGYVSGAPEHMPEALATLGLDVHLLSDGDIAWGMLESHDIIVIGPNAYVRRPALRTHARRLLDYVEEGGTLLVQHQGYGYARPGLAPYPLSFREPHDRVTDEHAPIVTLEASHPALNRPNLLAARDFDGWVRDRGMYFLGPRDPRYHALLACADPGEDPKDGGLVTAEYGRGLYVYCAYSLFRQVPAGAAGAVRLMANLLALPHTMGHARAVERRRRDRRARTA